jgi:hypothetical protein
MNRTLNSLQKIKFNPLVNRIIFEQGKKKYKFTSVNLKPVIIRKYTTTSSSNNQPNNDHKIVGLFIGIVLGFTILYKK